MKNVIKKINIIIILLVIAVSIPNYCQAVGDAFSSAEDFLEKRRSNI